MFEEIPFEEWQRVINLNLTGTFLCSQAAFGMMKEQMPMGGRIINTVPFLHMCLARFLRRIQPANMG